MRRLLTVALLVPVACLGGYSRRSTITFSGASSGTLTNFTVYSATIGMSDLKLAPAGVIQHTTVRNGVTLPTDLIVTDDIGCGVGSTPYKWDTKFYDGTAGTIVLLILIPGSYTTSPAVPYVCFGNSAVSAYQGGTVGSAYSANLMGFWPQPDGTTLNSNDFSVSACNGVPTNVTPVTAKIDGGGSYTTAASRNMLGGTTCGSAGSGTAGTLDFFTFTYQGWINTATTSGDMYDAGASGLPQFRVNGGKLSLDNTNVGNIGVSTGSISTGVFHHAAVTFDGSAGPGGSGTWTFYIDGAASGTGTATIPANWSPTLSRFINHTWRLGQVNTTPNMTMDENGAYNIVQPANWIATEYANQNNPPAMSAPVSLGVCALAALGAGTC
jgi:hypothetical protein